MLNPADFPDEYYFLLHHSQWEQNRLAMASNTGTLKAIIEAHLKKNKDTVPKKCWKGKLCGLSKECIDEWIKCVRENELANFVNRVKGEVKEYYYKFGHFPRQVVACPDCSLENKGRWDVIKCDTCDGNNFHLANTTWNELFDSNHPDFKSKFSSPANHLPSPPYFVISVAGWSSKGIEVSEFSTSKEFLESIEEYSSRSVRAVFVGEEITIPEEVWKPILIVQEREEAEQKRWEQRQQEMKANRGNENIKRLEKLFDVIPFEAARTARIKLLNTMVGRIREGQTL